MIMRVTPDRRGGWFNEMIHMKAGGTPSQLSSKALGSGPLLSYDRDATVEPSAHVQYVGSEI